MLSFDESLNNKLQKGQMDIIVRFWYEHKCIIQSRYLNSPFLGGAKAEQILEAFEKCMEKVSPANMIQISSDGPNVNLKILRLITERREFSDLLPLLNIGTCGLHTVHGSLNKRDYRFRMET